MFHHTSNGCYLVHPDRRIVPYGVEELRLKPVSKSYDYLIQASREINCRPSHDSIPLKSRPSIVPDRLSPPWLHSLALDESFVAHA